MVLKTLEIYFKFHHLTALFLVSFVAAALFLTQDISYWNIIKNQVNINEEQPAENDNSSAICDFFSGKWIYDNISYPLYKEKQCSFMEDGFACETYGRKDFRYRHWRWQPHHCDIPRKGEYNKECRLIFLERFVSHPPTVSISFRKIIWGRSASNAKLRFNGKAFLEKIRGKKMVFVGDSLNRNQWVSLLCLIEPSLPPSSNKTLVLKGNLYFFHDMEYNITIGFYWSPFLVESNCDNVWRHRVKGRIIRVGAIEKHAKQWNDSDILIFNSYAWWLDPTIKILRGSFESSDAINKTVEMKVRHYEMALATWSDWLRTNINQTKTKLFFMSRSPYIFRGDKLGSCYNRSEPLFFKNGYWNVKNHSMMGVAESTIEKLEKRGVKVEYLRITEMSEYRRDAHPSIYRRFYSPLTEEEKKDPTTSSDCLHWCLPGVPDIWNQILYAYIMKN